jgi:hypothetical protein
MLRPETVSRFITAHRQLVRRSVLFVALMFATRVAGEVIQSYDTLTLKDGRKFTAVQIVNYTVNGVLVRHAQGATTFRFDVLPDDVIAALHLNGWQTNPAISDIAALADKPAVAESDLASLADRPAVETPATTEALPAAAPASTPVASVSSLADQPAVEAPVVAVAPKAPAAPAPAGEGNIPEFFTAQQPVVGAAQNNSVDLAGRVFVTLPTGERFFLGDVDVRAYPAELLAGYIDEAKAKAQQAAQNLRVLASVALKDGRTADANGLLARAQRVAQQYADYLPAAPVSTRSDEFGNFTLRHNLHDLRIVASGRLNLSRGQWSYEWVGIAPAADAALTEANATAVIPADASQPRYAAR